MEKWSDKVLSALDMEKTTAFCISDYVDKMAEEEIDGAEHAHEHEDKEEHEEEKHYNQDNVDAFNEHIWTSPNNAIKMVKALEELLIGKDKSNENLYTKNSKRYIEDIKILQTQIKEITDNKIRNRLVFGDKMPMQYFLNEFNVVSHSNNKARSGITSDFCFCAQSSFKL